MCGIAGYDGFGKAIPERLKLLLIDNENRGTHSTGVYGSQLLKKPVRASVFIGEEELSDILNVNTVLTHTRFATMGPRDENGAHPFEIGDIVGTHNGWLTDTVYNDIIDTYGYDKEELDVDSKLIFHHMNEHGIERVADIEGAMALAFVFDGKLHLYRRSSKPLYFLEHKRSIYYSSRSEGLDMLGLGKSNLLKSDFIYSFRNGRLVGEIEIEEPSQRILLDETPTEFRNRTTNRNVTSSSFYRGSNYQGNQTQIELKEVFENWNTGADYASNVNRSGHPIHDKALMEVLGYQKFPAKITSKLISNRRPDNNQSVVIFTLESLIADSKEVNSLDNFRIMINGYSHAVSTTNNKGIGALVIPPQYIGTDVGFIIYPPDGFFCKNSRKKRVEAPFFFNSESIKIEDQRVLGVTLNIPFLSACSEASTKVGPKVNFGETHGDHELSGIVCPIMDGKGDIIHEEATQSILQETETAEETTSTALTTHDYWRTKYPEAYEELYDGINYTEHQGEYYLNNDDSESLEDIEDLTTAEITEIRDQMMNTYQAVRKALSSIEGQDDPNIIESAAIVQVKKFIGSIVPISINRLNEANKEYSIQKFNKDTGFASDRMFLLDVEVILNEEMKELDSKIALLKEEEESELLESYNENNVS